MKYKVFFILASDLEKMVNSIAEQEWEVFNMDPYKTDGSGTVIEYAVMFVKKAEDSGN